MSLYTQMESMSFREYDITNKQDAINAYCFDMMNRIASMFEYTGDIPESFKPEFMDIYLMYYGHCCIFKHNGDLFVSFGNWADKPDPYYIPTKYTVADPYLKPTQSSFQYTDGVDCIIVKNDQHARGLKALFEKHATLLVENDISRLLAEYNSRVSDLLSAEDDRTKASAELFLKGIKDGKLGIITSNAMLDSFKAYRQTSGNNTTLLPLIEHHQYIKSEWLADIGLDSNWNGKREAVNSAETALNKDYLMPLIDQMLLQRQTALERLKELWGYDIKVTLSSSWETNSKEEDAELDALENAADNDTPDNTEGGDENVDTSSDTET